MAIHHEMWKEETEWMKEKKRKEKKNQIETIEWNGSLENKEEYSKRKKRSRRTNSREPKETNSRLTFTLFHAHLSFQVFHQIRAFHVHKLLNRYHSRLVIRQGNEKRKLGNRREAKKNKYKTTKLSMMYRNNYMVTTTEQHKNW